MSSAGGVWLVRHGRTAWNGHCFLGRAGVPLDPVGQRQARDAGRLLAGERLEVVYTSPLPRARQTAARLLELQTGTVRAIERAELVELDCGEWEGRLKNGTRISRRDPVEPLPGGESIVDVWRRVSHFAEGLRNDADNGRSVAVVGHYLAGRLLCAVLVGVPLNEALHGSTYRPEPGSVFELGLEQGRMVARGFRTWEPTEVPR
jgi:broad specificity phosphatase PhoE